MNVIDWNSSQGQASRPKFTVDHFKVTTGCGEVAVMRLTARGADLKDPEDVALGGQYLRNSRREVKGTMLSEKIGSGENITIQSRAVL